MQCTVGHSLQWSRAAARFPEGYAVEMVRD
jgi:hypothetical protein